MKFKIDENLPIEVVQILVQAGHDAVTVREQNMGGGSDTDLAQICSRENRAIITLDTDFTDIRTYPPKDFAGLIVLRLKQQDKFYVMQIMERLLRSLHEEAIEKKLWIVEEQRIRIRE